MDHWLVRKYNAGMIVHMFMLCLWPAEQLNVLQVHCLCDSFSACHSFTLSLLPQPHTLFLMLRQVPGDLQLLNNHRTVHMRTSFQDDLQVPQHCLFG